MKKNIILILIITIVFLSSCNKWLDVNDDPNVAQDIKINLMLPSIEYDLAKDLTSGVGYACAVFTHQYTGRDDYDAYGINAQSYANTGYWNDLYSGPAKEIEVLIQKSEEQDNLKYAGIGKILKAYLYSQIVDIWGDVPYSEANVKNNFSPKFDNDEDIYADLFVLIDDGVADLNNSESLNIISPGDDDLIYGGSTEKWIKFSNTLKLKLYTQVQKTTMWNATKVQALIDEDNFITSDDDNEEFLFPFGTSSNPDNRNPGFGEYSPGQVSTYISPWIFQIMMGMNPDILTHNRDPRIPYYWCRQGRVENTPEYFYQDTSKIEINPGDTIYNPNKLKFVSIYFGSVGIHRDAGGRATFTLPGIYPVGGKFDDGTMPLNPTNGLSVDDAVGSSPARLYTYADLLYTKAELFNRGLATGDADATFSDALDASFALVDKVVEDNATSNQIIPKIATSHFTTVYKQKVIDEYNAASNDGKLEIIMTQKWLERFGGASVDSYTDYRRTGYPVLFTGENGIKNGFAHDGASKMVSGKYYYFENDTTYFKKENYTVPIQITRSYPVSWPYPQNELDHNINANSQKNQTTDKVFWDVN